MNKNELIKRVAEKLDDVPRKVAAKAVDAVFESIAEGLQEDGIVTIIAATKADKLNRSKIRSQQGTLKNGFGADIPMIIFSSHTGQGKNELWKEIKKLID